MADTSSILDLIANGGAMRVIGDQRAQDIMNQHNRAATDVVRQQAEQKKMETQGMQQAARDAAILRGIYANVGRQATAAQNAPAKMPGGLINRSGQTLDNVPSVAVPGAAVQTPLAPAPSLYDNPQAFAMEVARNGGSASAVQNAFTHALDMKEKTAKLTGAELANEKLNHDAVAGHLQGYLENQTPEAWAATKAEIIRREPELAGEVSRMGATPNEKELAHLIGAVHAGKQLLDAQEQKQKIALAEREAEDKSRAAGDVHETSMAALPGVAAEAQGKQAQLPVTQAIADATLEDPGLLNPEQRQKAKEAEATASETAKRDQHAWDVALGHLNVSKGELALRNKEFQQKYGDALENMSPSNRAIAEKLAVGDYDPAKLRGIKGNDQIVAGAIALNPQWTPQIYATKKAFTDPEKGQSKNLGTISRIVGHIERYEANSEKAGYAPLFGFGANLTGDARALSEDSHAIAGELEKLVSGGVGSKAQVQEWQSALRSSLPDVRQRAIDEISKLVGSQYEGMNQTYKAGVGKDLPIEKYVSPEGRKWMQSKGIQVGGGESASGPAVGAIEEGHRFKGGNPADPKNWEKVN